MATPIGNLSDASPRSVEVLRSVDLVACEDTRTTRTLLEHHGIAARTVALHEHNERAAAKGLIAALRDGKSVALVSDAGTPGIADPGALLVAEVHRAGLRVSPVPGPSAAAAAFSAAGFVAPGYRFAGFLPASGGARRKAIEALDGPLPVVLFEAPHRIARTLADLAEKLGPAREIALARELSKKFEEVARLTLGDAESWLKAPHRQQGEFVIVVSGMERQAGKAPQPLDADRVLDVLLESLAPSEAAKAAARITGLAKGELYRKALTRRK
ncbi:MAG TPA: 16S rRNA (cytidine(1402)-2'-O)-methyltransferase [Burkholderiales bacterium]|nr:16S rRNA (cytidine(1402)-2'-O)-methyltransferase [Burkholderiales bacterium]